MARRFTTSFQMAQTSSGFQQAWLTNTAVIAGAAGGICYTDGDLARLYVAPFAYSEVRKVTFWACIRHEYTGTSSPVNVVLRVAPSSSSPTSRVIDSTAFASSSMSRTGGAGVLVWPATSSSPSNEAVFYSDVAGHRNTIATQRQIVHTSSGSQMIYREFDRFDAGDVNFFNDWDLIDALGSDAEHIAYQLGIQRTDGIAWITSGNTNQRAPIIVACGFSVTQAPSPGNKTRVYLPANFAFTSTGAVTTTFGGERACPFFYHEDEWSGDFEIRVISRQGPSGSTSGFFESRVNRTTNQSTVFTTMLTQSFGSAASNGGIWFARSQEFSSLLTNNDALGLQHRSLSGGSMTAPFSWYEITLRDFNVMTTFFASGHPPATAALMPAGAPPPEKFDTSSSLFDPLWFEDFESERFLASRVYGGLYHLGASNQTEQTLTSNSFLDANVATSLFNAEIDPEISSTANATLGMKYRFDPIESNDPVNGAGRRKLTTRFHGTQWLTGTGDFPGVMGLAYVINVPNTDVITLGPLFDLGAFNPEGCAATSAGLGEPGVLVITNGTSIPKKFNPNAAGTASEVEDVGIPTPFEGELPQAIPSDAAGSPDGGLEIGIYKYHYTFRNCCTGKESDPNIDVITVDTTGQSPFAKVTFSFASIRIPGDPQICEICLYRTVEGGEVEQVMAKVGCFNVDDTTVFVDDMSDANLPFSTSPISFLNAPMPCVSIVVDFRNRLFGMGDVPNLTPEGTVSVVNGSDIVQGSGEVVWDRCLEGKFIYIGADCRSYEVLRVLPPETGTSPAIARLKLTEEYSGESDSALSYHICGRPNRLYFSEPLEPEYWPASGFIDIEPGDGDRLMGAVSNYDRLVICKRRKSYVLTFRENPGIEVLVPSRISSDIGCVGPRTFAQIESGSVWLADRGLAIFDGRTVDHVPESTNMNDLFVDPENPNYIRRDRNGRVIDAVGVFYPKKEQYLLLLPTVQTDRGCNLMLVWDVKLRNITLLKFCQQFQSMVVAKDSQGNERVYLGDVNGFVWIYDIGDTDGVGYPNATGTVRGDITFAGLDDASGASVLDSDGASFIEGGIPSFASLSGIVGLSGALEGTEMGLAGACVYTRLKNAAYDDPWVQRTIYAATSTRLYVTPQWGPDTPFDENGEFEFEFMIGPIQLDLIFKPQNYGVDDTQKRDWRQIVVHEPEQFASQLRIDLLPDFQSIDPEAETVVDPVTNEVGEGRVFRMDYSKGRQVRPTGRYIHNHMAVRMRNFAPEEPIRIINHILCAQPSRSK